MKKVYEKSQCVVIHLAYTENMLNPTTVPTVTVPGGGSGTPDLSRQGGDFFKDSHSLGNPWDD